MGPMALGDLVGQELFWKQRKAPAANELEPLRVFFSFFFKTQGALAAFLERDGGLWCFGTSGVFFLEAKKWECFRFKGRMDLRLSRSNPKSSGISFEANIALRVCLFLPPFLVAVYDFYRHFLNFERRFLI